MATKKKALQAAAGNAGGDLLAIEDVFSTYLYTGNGTSQTITNGIDLAGEGGLVWTKSRSSTWNNTLIDTENGGDLYLYSNTTVGHTLPSPVYITSFNSDGYTISTANELNSTLFSTNNYASWTFRKAPRFFDVVTYTGTGSVQNVSHNLGVAPGVIITKRTDSTSDWGVYHRSYGSGGPAGILNGTDAAFNLSTYWNDTDPTDTQFTLGSFANVNASGGTYVAYLFAHDPLGPSGDGSDGLIACGSYTGNASSDGPEINIGWEPQWLLVKDTTNVNDWFIWDTMRGLPNGVPNSSVSLNPNKTDAEVSEYGTGPTSTGFKIQDNNAAINTSGSTYIYIAIRRGPMRQPTSGTEVFHAESASAGTLFSVGFPSDFHYEQRRDSTGSANVFASRLTGSRYFLRSNGTNAEYDSTVDNAFDFTLQDSFKTNYQAGTLINYQFRRAPGFFDVVAYTGGTNAVPHNLGVSPELVIVKQRNASGNNWAVGASFTASNFVFGYLNSTYAGVESSYTNRDFSQQPDENNVYLNTASSRVNTSGNTYIAYLFATLAGVSKVGSYTGNGSSQTINCGFTSGARFVLIKRTDATDEWTVFDSVRGITSNSSDPLLYLNTTDAEFTESGVYGSGTIDPDPSGFIIKATGFFGEDLNASGGTYIFLAIA